MPTVLNTNVASLRAADNLLGAQEKLSSSVERLSSGLRINRAKDDAAGLGVISAWPERREIWAGGIRGLNNLHETYRSDLNPRTAPQKTAAHMFGGLWLSDGRMFKFSRSKSDAWVAQVWGAPK